MDRLLFRAFANFGDKFPVMIYDVVPYPDGMVGCSPENLRLALLNSNYEYANEGEFYDCNSDRVYDPRISEGDNWYWISGLNIMQYIWLDEIRDDDLECKRIYQGDIVECDRYENHERYIVTINDIRTLPRELYGSNLNSRKVLGNIHINTELVEKFKIVTNHV